MFKSSSLCASLKLQHKRFELRRFKWFKELTSTTLRLCCSSCVSIQSPCLLKFNIRNSLRQLTDVIRNS